MDAPGMLVDHLDLSFADQVVIVSFEEVQTQ